MTLIACVDFVFCNSSEYTWKEFVIEFWSNLKVGFPGRATIKCGRDTFEGGTSEFKKQTMNSPQNSKVYFGNIIFSSALNLFQGQQCVVVCCVYIFVAFVCQLCFLCVFLFHLFVCCVCSLVRGIFMNSIYFQTGTYLEFQNIPIKSKYPHLFNVSSSWLWR